MRHSDFTMCTEGGLRAPRVGGVIARILPTGELKTLTPDSGGALTAPPSPQLPSARCVFAFGGHDDRNYG